jgi:hypothetical protein
MYCSRENKYLLGGCRSRTPCIKSSALRIKRSFWPSFPFAINLSKVLINLKATFHSKPS